MANLLKITRGDRNFVTGFFQGTGLADGQLFWQATNNDTDSVTPWDEGTLYVGRPDLKNSAPIAIAGPRATQSLIYRGIVTGSTHIDNDIFLHATTGDFWIFSSNVKDSATPDPAFLEFDFRKGDILLVTSSVLDSVTGITSEITFLRMNNSGGSASDTYFDNSNSNIVATNASDALKELETEKLSYRGAIYSQTAAALIVPEIGTMYLVGVDNLVVSTFTPDRLSTTTLTGPAGRSLKKGDFIYHLKDSLNDIAIWFLIPSGYTDAIDIDLHTSNTIADDMMATFNEDHVASVRNLTNVEQSLAFLLQYKAQIDATGKIPLAQLPDTILGSLQYKGTWNPLDESTYDSATLAQHYNEVAYQTQWPSFNDGPSDGDYYIVQTTNIYPNISYSDQSSSFANGQYARKIELNKGDWIVWTNSPVDNDASVAHWEKIDNSDRISVINFGINTILTGDRDPNVISEYTAGRTGSPKLRADHKIGLYEHADGSIVVAGIRLIDQSRTDNSGIGKSNFIPRYTQYTDSVSANNTIENSNIEDSIANGVVIHHNLQVGDANASFSETVYGDIRVLPDTVLVDGVPTRTRNGIELANPQNPLIDNTLNWLTRILSSENVSSNISVIMPELDSVIIGKIPSVALLPRRLTKSIRDGFIMSTSIEEHTTTDATGVDTDETATIVEIHAPTLNVDNVGLRHLVFGNRNNLGTGFASDGSLVDNYLTNLFAHTEVTSNITLILPSRSGILLTNIDWAEFVSGDENYIPIFGPISTDNKRKLINSQIKQVNNALFAAMRLAMGSEIDELGSTDKSFIDEFLPESVDENIDSRLKNIEIGQDVLIGKINQTTNEITKRGLQVTKFIGLGNDETNNTFIVPGRKLFPDSLQYKDPFTYIDLPVETIYVELPAVSGVLLTDNSCIDGGVFGDDIEFPVAGVSETPIGG